MYPLIGGIHVFRYPLKGCGAVWRPAGDADQTAWRRSHADTSWPCYYYCFYYYYYYCLIMVGITRSKIISSAFKGFF